MAVTALQDNVPFSAILSSAVTEYQQRKAAAVDANRCLVRGCELAPADDSEMCPQHRDGKRARNRRWMQARRRKWERERKCLDCGRRRALGRKRCPECLIKRDRVKSAGVDRVVDATTQKAARTRLVTEGDGYTRERDVGQGKRGPQPRHQRDEQDLAAAIRELQRAQAGLAYAASDEVRQLPRAQRDEATKEAIARALYGIRLAAQVPVRHGLQIPDLTGDGEDG